MGSLRLESTQREYKLDLELKKPKSWLKTISAFANTHGGCITFGVEDERHEARGIDNPQSVICKISELIGARISPVPRYTLSEVNIDGRICVDVVIHNGPAYPYYYVHEKTREAYIRHGDRSEIATAYELNDLILRGQNRTFDSLASTYTTSDVSFTLLGATYKKERGEDLLFPRDLVSMNLLDENGMVTNAGLLMCDQGLMRQSKIVCTRWKGCSKGGIDGDALDDKEFCNASLISLLHDAESFIRNNSKNSWTVRGMRREENSDYPYSAVREVLVNAMIHRDYQMLGTEIHVDMFDDRMEIVSPGGMISGNRIQDLDLRSVPSMRRNEIISDIFGRLRYMDRRGSGIGRILNSYTEFSQQPGFFSNEMCFSVALPNRSVAERAQLSFDMANTQLGDEKAQLSASKAQQSSQRRNLATPENYWELEYFRAVVLPNSHLSFRRKTIEGIEALFEKYRYIYAFNRRNVAELLGVSENRSSNIIRECLEKHLIEKEKKDVYRFTDQSEPKGK